MKPKIPSDEISLCEKCHCMTKDVYEFTNQKGKVFCGKCYEQKKILCYSENEKGYVCELKKGHKGFHECTTKKAWKQ